VKSVNQRLQTLSILLNGVCSPSMMESSSSGGVLSGVALEPDARGGGRGLRGVCGLGGGLGLRTVPIVTAPSPRHRDTISNFKSTSKSTKGATLRVALMAT
jgi:hypothetical protein